MSYRVLLPQCDCGECGQCRAHRDEGGEAEAESDRPIHRRPGRHSESRSPTQSRWNTNSDSNNSNNEESDGPGNSSDEEQEQDQDKNGKRKATRRGSDSAQRHKKQRGNEETARAQSAPIANRAPDSAASAAAPAVSPAAAPALFTERPLATWSLQFAALFQARPYHADWFRDTPALKELTCSICLAPACDPPNLSCGHLACSGCLQGWLKQSRSCPECRMPVDPSSLRSNAFVQRAIWQLPVQCPFASAGCGWRDEHFGTEGRNLRDHATLCKFQEVTCQHCEITIKYRDMETHLTQCTHRRIKCASCEAQLLFNKFAAHQPAFKEGSADNEGVDDGSFDPDEPQQAEDESDASSSSAAAAASSSSSASASAAAASASFGAAAFASGAAVGSRVLLPPFIPPCVNSEICQRGCEDPLHPGHVSTYPTYLAWSHDSTCPRRLEECTLCAPAHRIEAAQLHAHYAQVCAGVTSADSAVVQRLARCLRRDEAAEDRLSDLKRRLSTSESRVKYLEAKVKDLESMKQRGCGARCTCRGSCSFPNRGRFVSGARGGRVVGRTARDEQFSSESDPDMGPE